MKLYIKNSLYFFIFSIIVLGFNNCSELTLSGLSETSTLEDENENSNNNTGDTGTDDPGTGGSDNTDTGGSDNTDTGGSDNTDVGDSVLDFEKRVVLLETFENSNLDDRGWFDGGLSKIVIDPNGFSQNNPGSLKMKYLRGDVLPGGMGAIRRNFEGSQELVVDFKVKYSSNWVGSQKKYHPHELYILTDADDKWIGPALTHLTVYIESLGKKPLVAIQDGLNVDKNNIRTDLVGSTENRAVGGCNGPNSGKTGNCYQSSGKYRNGTNWAGKEVFSDSGDYDKSKWHAIKVYVKMNTIVNGKSQADGIIKYWFDGELVINRTDLYFRTNLHPNIKFNNFLIGPYIGDGSPVEQTYWLDDLKISIPD